MTTKVSHRIKSGVKNTPLRVYLEKHFVDESAGRAAVIFTTNKKKDAVSHMRAPQALELAFSEAFQGKAQLIGGSVMHTDVSGTYSAIVSLNRSTVSEEVALADGSGFHQTTANVFSDEEDAIWTMQDSSNGRVLVRTEEENLGDLLAPLTSISTASANVFPTESFTPGCLVRHMDIASGKTFDGVAVDTATVFDIQTEKFRKVRSVDVLAVGDDMAEDLSEQLLSVVGGDETAYEAASLENKAAVKAFLRTLYSQNKDFLNTYLAAVDKYCVA